MSNLEQDSDVLEMSDEDFMKVDPSEFETDIVEDDPIKIEEERRASLTDEEREAEDRAGDNANNDEDDDPGKIEEARRAALSQEERDEEDEEIRREALTDDERAAEDTAITEEETRRAALTEEQRTEEDKVAEKADKKVKNKSDDETTDSQFADIGRQIMSEFKANGSVIKMKTAEDAIRLMQMGANYHKKMAGLKPSLKTLKLLENNGLLDPEKLNYLIDLSQKKPEAITQLLKDSKIDPMDIDLKGEETYIPSQRTISDKAVDLDDVLDSISESEHYDRTLTVLGDDWDDQSRSSIADNPEAIRTINLHMESGIFDQVIKTVEYERRLGKLKGVSDFDAYQRIGAYMHENKMFSANVDSNQQEQQNRQDNQSQKSDTQQEQQQERKNRKKAASSSRQRQTPTKGKDNYNPLAMSDEEFVKHNKINI